MRQTSNKVFIMLLSGFVFLVLQILLYFLSSIAYLETENCAKNIEHVDRSNMDLLTWQVKRMESLAIDNNASKERVKTLKSQLLRSKATLENYNAQLSYAKQQVKRCKLDAPFNGIVIERFSDIGELAIPGTNIIRIMNNDMIGNIKGVDGVIDNRTFRIFSESVPQTETEEQRINRRKYGGEVDGISRQLARYIHKNVKTYMPEMNPMMVYRLDRFGRGGHHRPFNDVGFAGIRIMEAHENYTQQHQDIRVEDGISYGDTFEHVNFPYAKKLTAVNAINLASLASAPPPPKNLEIGGIVKPSVKFKWEKVDGATGYKIYWRDTTSPTWDNSRYVGDVTEFTLEGIVIDNFFFGVATVGEDGHESMVVFPNKIIR